MAQDENAAPCAFPGGTSRCENVTGSPTKLGSSSLTIDSPPVGQAYLGGSTSNVKLIGVVLKPTVCYYCKFHFLTRSAELVENEATARSCTHGRLPRVNIQVTHSELKPNSPH